MKDYAFMKVQPIKSFQDFSDLSISCELRKIDHFDIEFRVILDDVGKRTFQRLPIESTANF